jgi:uridylate kinase
MISKFAVSLFFLLILCQSCTVYQKTSVPLSEAYAKGKVKVKSKSGKVFLFHDIMLADGTYYGLTKASLKTEESNYKQVEYSIPLTDEQVDGVYLKDPKKSKRRSILFATSPIILVGSYIAIIVILLLLGVLSIA